jgi:FkbM family methyltransferase
MRPTKTLHVRLGEESYQVKYPYSPAMKHVLTDVFRGRDYPHCLPADQDVETIIDVGANVGAAAIWFHHRYPQARIVSYEPSSNLFDLLCENTRAIDSVEAKNVGWLDRDATAQLHRGQHHDAQNSLVAHAETSEQSDTITLRRASEELQSLDVARISILKLDTEG